MGEKLFQMEQTISLYWLMKALKFKSSVLEGIKQTRMSEPKKKKKNQDEAGSKTEKVLQV